VQVQTDGKIVVAGTARDYGMYENMFVARLKDNGQNDTYFNGYGINILDNGDSDRGTSLALAGDSIFVGGEGYGSKATIWKFDANGKLNYDFGINGRWSGDSGTVADLAVQNTGKIVWTGDAVKLGRVATNGSTDASFQSPAFTLPFLQFQHSTALAKYGQDKVVVAGFGESIGDDWDGLVGRYHAGSVPNAPTIEWSSATGTTSFQLKWNDNSSTSPRSPSSVRPTRRSPPACRRP
jgi:hypothetical protein